MKKFNILFFNEKLNVRLGKKQYEELNTRFGIKTKHQEQISKANFIHQINSLKKKKKVFLILKNKYLKLSQFCAIKQQHLQ